MTGRVIVALDLPGAGPALDMVDRIGPACTFCKVGLELYTAEGPAGCGRCGTAARRCSWT